MPQLEANQQPLLAGNSSDVGDPSSYNDDVVCADHAKNYYEYAITALFHPPPNSHPRDYSSYIEGDKPVARKEETRRISFVLFCFGFVSFVTWIVAYLLYRHGDATYDRTMARYSSYGIVSYFLLFLAFIALSLFVFGIDFILNILAALHFQVYYVLLAY